MGLIYVPKRLETSVLGLAAKQKVGFAAIVNAALSAGLPELIRAGIDRTIRQHAEEDSTGSIYVMPTMTETIKAEIDSADDPERFRKVTVIALEFGLELAFPAGSGKEDAKQAAKAKPPAPPPSTPASAKPKPLRFPSACVSLMHQYSCRSCGAFEITHAHFLTLGGKKPKCPTCVAAA